MSKMQLAGRDEHFLWRMAGQRSVIPVEMHDVLCRWLGIFWRLATLKVTKCGSLSPATQGLVGWTCAEGQRLVGNLLPVLISSHAL